MKELRTKFIEFLEECERKLDVPEKEQICLNCRFRCMSSEALCKCHLFNDIGSLDDSCDHFKISINYIGSQLRKELINEQSTTI